MIAIGILSVASVLAAGLALLIALSHSRREDEQKHRSRLP